MYQRLRTTVSLGGRGTLTRNTAYNLGGALVPLVVSVATVPLYIDEIGLDRYGVLLVAWLLLGYFGFADLGLTRATAHHVARLSNSEPAARQALFVAAVTLNVLAGIVGAAVLYLVATLVLTVMLDAPAHLSIETKQIVPWIAVGVPAITLTGVLNGALEGVNRFGAVNLITSVSTSLFQVVPLLVAIAAGPQLDELVASAVIVRYVTLIALMAAVAHTLPLSWSMPWSVRSIRAQSRQLVPYGLWITADKVLGPLLAAIDRLLIGTVFSASAVSVYGACRQPPVRARMLPLALTRALFPRLSVFPRGAPEALNIIERASGALGVLSAPIVIAGIIAMRPFLEIWVGAAFSGDAAFVGQTVLAGMWLSGLALVPFTLLQADGRPRAVARIRALQVVPYALAMSAGLITVGLAAAPVAWTIQVTVDCFWLARSAGIGRAMIRGSWAPGTLVCVAWLATALSASATVLPLVIAGAALIASLACAAPTVRGLLGSPRDSSLTQPQKEAR